MRSAKVNPKLKSLLEKVSEYPNIPRKKSKFEVESLIEFCFTKLEIVVFIVEFCSEQL